VERVHCVRKRGRVLAALGVIGAVSHDAAVIACAVVGLVAVGLVAVLGVFTVYGRVGVVAVVVIGFVAVVNGGGLGVVAARGQGEREGEGEEEAGAEGLERVHGVFLIFASRCEEEGRGDDSETNWNRFHTTYCA
jgi:hypothetical protein